MLVKVVVHSRMRSVLLPRLVEETHDLLGRSRHGLEDVVSVIPPESNPHVSTVDAVLTLTCPAHELSLVPQLHELSPGPERVILAVALTQAFERSRMLDRKSVV